MDGSVRKDSARGTVQIEVSKINFKTKAQVASEIFPESVENVLDAVLLVAVENNFELAACLIPYFHSLAYDKLSASLASGKYSGIAGRKWETRSYNNSVSPHPEQPRSSPATRQTKQTSNDKQSYLETPTKCQALPNFRSLKRDRNPSDPEKPDEHDSPKRAKSGSRLARKIYACHFQKFNPQKFHLSIDQNFSGCVASSLLEICRIL